MQILNLANKEKSDIKYSISRFPDGEIQITLTRTGVAIKPKMFEDLDLPTQFYINRGDS